MDITVYMEVRDRNSGKWNIAPVKVQYSHYVASDPSKPHVLDKRVLDWHYAQPYTGRNDALFDVLRGGTYYSILDYDRGLPADVTNEVNSEHEKFKSKESGKFFSFDESWLTLAELYAALSNKKKYPKWEKWLDEAGIEQKEPGVRADLKDFVSAIQHFVNIQGYYDTNDVRIVYWFDS